MFGQNDEEKKLDWMYKGPNSMVDREEYLLGRSVDKTLETLNAEEKQKQLGAQPKNRVEHECIPPSIRDFNKIVQSEQVDLSAKLQEDPLVAIKKREEETRREFLQNPIQLKKLQKALKAQEKKRKKKQRKSKRSNEATVKKSSKQHSDDLDTILIHKFNELKNKLSEQDIRDILDGKISDSDDENSGGDDDDKKTSRTGKRGKYLSESGESSDDFDKKNSYGGNRKDRRVNQYNRNDRQARGLNQKNQRDNSRRTRDNNDSDSEEDKILPQKPVPQSSQSKYYDSDDSDVQRRQQHQNWGLVKSDGSKIPLNKNVTNKSNSVKKNTKPAGVDQTIAKQSNDRFKAKRMSEEEKEKLRKEMMQNAAWRDKERESKVKKYREKEAKEGKEPKDFDPEFIHKQLKKSANNSSIESRIKSNLNNIQRSGRDMNKNFSRR